MKRLIGPILVVVALGVGAWYLLRPERETRGEVRPGPGAVADEAAQTTLIGNLTAQQKGETVHIAGVITKECPHTGCWAYVKDDTGQIRIDTKKGGFALPLGREGARISVTGTLEVKQNGDLEISATSAQL